MSTAIAGIPNEKHKTTAADFGPMPGNCCSHALACSRGICFRKVKSISGRNWRIRLSTVFIRGAFTWLRPPILMHCEIVSMSPSVIFCIVPKCSIKLLNARSEFMSEVCCERIVNTSSVVGSYRGRHLTSPYSFLSCKITSWLVMGWLVI